MNECVKAQLWILVLSFLYLSAHAGKNSKMYVVIYSRDRFCGVPELAPGDPDCSNTANAKVLKGYKKKNTCAQKPGSYNQLQLTVYNSAQRTNPQVLDLTCDPNEIKPENMYLECLKYFCTELYSDHIAIETWFIGKAKKSSYSAENFSYKFVEAYPVPYGRMEVNLRSQYAYRDSAKSNKNQLWCKCSIQDLVFEADFDKFAQYNALQIGKTGESVRMKYYSKCDSRVDQTIYCNCTSYYKYYICDFFGFQVCVDQNQGPNCEGDINECNDMEYYCVNSVKCNNFQGRYLCTCTSEFTGTRCDLPFEQHFNISEAAFQCEDSPDICQNGGVCVNIVSEEGMKGFKCNCTEGITGMFCDRRERRENEFLKRIQKILRDTYEGRPGMIALTVVLGVFGILLIIGIFHLIEIMHHKRSV